METAMPRAAIRMPEQPYLRECLRYSRKTGAVKWRRRPLHHFANEGVWCAWNSRFAGKIAGTPDPKGYTRISVNGVIYKAHRLVWKLVTGMEPTAGIDHKDTNPMN